MTIMATKNKQRATSSKEKMSARVKRAYMQGYKNGFEDSTKAVNGSKFFSTRGYNQGYGDKQRIRKIEKKYSDSKKYF